MNKMNLIVPFFCKREFHFYTDCLQENDSSYCAGFEREVRIIQDERDNFLSIKAVLDRRWHKVKMKIF